MHYLLIAGIWVAMHGVASYAHVYMGYEILHAWAPLTWHLKHYVCTA